MDFNEEEDACEHCGSHWFQIVDGRKTCSNGHVQEDGPVVGEDEADFGNQGKVSRVKDQRAKVKVLKGKAKNLAICQTTLRCCKFAERMMLTFRFSIQRRQSIQALSSGLPVDLVETMLRPYS